MKYKLISFTLFFFTILNLNAQSSGLIFDKTFKKAFDYSKKEKWNDLKILESELCLGNIIPSGGCLYFRFLLTSSSSPYSNLFEHYKFAIELYKNLELSQVKNQIELCEKNNLCINMMDSVLTQIEVKLLSEVILHNKKEYIEGLFANSKNKKLLDSINLFLESELYNTIVNNENKSEITVYYTKYPSGRYIHKIKKIEHKINWNEIKQSNEKKPFVNYINNYPESFFLNEAKSKVEWIEYHDVITNYKNIDSLNAFINKYPKSPFFKSVLDTLYKLEYQNVILKNKESDYSNYLLSYPKSPYNKLVKKKLTDFDKIIDVSLSKHWINVNSKRKMMYCNHKIEIIKLDDYGVYGMCYLKIEDTDKKNVAILDLKTGIIIKEFKIRNGVKDAQYNSFDSSFYFIDDDKESPRYRTIGIFQYDLRTNALKELLSFEPAQTKEVPILIKIHNNTLYTCINKESNIIDEFKQFLRNYYFITIDLTNSNKKTIPLLENQRDYFKSNSEADIIKIYNKLPALPKIIKADLISSLFRCNYYFSEKNNVYIIDYPYLYFIKDDNIYFSKKLSVSTKVSPYKFLDKTAIKNTTLLNNGVLIIEYGVSDLFFDLERTIKSDLPEMTSITLNELGWDSLNQIIYNPKSKNHGDVDYFSRLMGPKSKYTFVEYLLGGKSFYYQIKDFENIIWRITDKKNSMDSSDMIFKLSNTFDNLIQSADDSLNMFYKRYDYDRTFIKDPFEDTSALRSRVQERLDLFSSKVDSLKNFFTYELNKKMHESLIRVNLDPQKLFKLDNYSIEDEKWELNVYSKLGQSDFTFYFPLKKESAKEFYSKIGNLNIIITYYYNHLIRDYVPLKIDFEGSILQRRSSFFIPYKENSLYSQIQLIKNNYKKSFVDSMFLTNEFRIDKQIFNNFINVGKPSTCLKFFDKVYLFDYEKKSESFLADFNATFNGYSDIGYPYSFSYNNFPFLIDRYVRDNGSCCDVVNETFIFDNLGNSKILLRKELSMEKYYYDGIESLVNQKFTNSTKMYLLYSDGRLINKKTGNTILNLSDIKNSEINWDELSCFILVDNYVWPVGLIEMISELEVEK